MTISQAIEKLKALEVRHGANVDVYFDCPRCGTSFAPDLVVAEAIHLTSKGKKARP